MKKTEELEIRRLVDEQGESQLSGFNVDCDGYEITDSLRSTLENRHIAVNEETLTYLAKVIYDQLDEELENADE